MEKENTKSLTISLKYFVSLQFQFETAKHFLIL